MNSTKSKLTIQQAAQLLAEKHSVALFAHTNPDGDALGACLALRLALEKSGKKVGVFCDSPIGDKLTANFAELASVQTDFGGKFDIMVAVDCGDLNRVGQFGAMYGKFAETLTLDHHGGEYFSRYNVVTNYASTCQIIYELLDAMGVEQDERIATYLYMGLCTDTGNFSHSNTDKPSFLMAARLCELGADMQKVNRVFFKDTTLAETKLLGRALSHLRSYFDGQLVLMYITRLDFAESGADMGDTSGIVQHAVNVDSARVGVMLAEYAPNVYKVSMRGKDVCVRDICAQFGGGGHQLAAGCMISGFLEDVIEKIVRCVGFEL